MANRPSANNTGYTGFYTTATAMNMPLKHWEPVWRWVALFEALIVLLIVRGIVQDWLAPPQHYDWVDSFWGQNTEHADHLRLCGEDGSKCPRE